MVWLMEQGVAEMPVTRNRNKSNRKSTLNLAKSSFIFLLLLILLLMLLLLLLLLVLVFAMVAPLRQSGAALALALQRFGRVPSSNRWTMPNKDNNQWSVGSEKWAAEGVIGIGVGESLSICLLLNWH